MHAQSVLPAENTVKTDMRSHSLLSRLAYTLCIRSPNVGASRMAYLCRPLLDGPHVFSQEVAVWVDRFGLRTRTSSGKPREPSHKQGMQGHDIIHQSNSYTTSYNLRGACNGRRLRIYGFTDLPPSLPLLPGTPFTRISESSYRREGRMLSVVRVATRPLPSALRCPTGNCS